MLARIDSRRSVWQALSEFFSDPRLHQLFGADGRKVYEQLLVGLRPTAWRKLKL